MAEKKNTAGAKRRVQRKQIKKLTLGVTDALTNVVLYFLYVSGYMLTEGGKGPITVNRAFNKADRLIGEFDAKKLRKALNNLRQQGIISSTKEAASLPKITKTGMRRLKDRLPFYDEERTWDKNLYLVVYDIPIKHNPKRDVFRDALKLLKSAKIQDSVYLTPYNPQELVDRIVKEQNIRGEILVSTIDPNKGLGTVKNIKQFLWETYELEEVNDRYAKFIGSYSHIKKDRIEKLRTKIGFTYLSILQDDPQLPFDLLLNEYLGDKAYLLYEKLMST